ncbi:MAG: class II fructose-bisphosphate aldolase [Clostridia bacterium]|nr:class II fructose-bisphosphate aldolase [Clostridia bacterium]
MLVTLNELLPKAAAEGYAVGLFNTTDSDMLQAVIDAAEEVRSPVIIGTAEILLPSGELSLISPSIVSIAKHASVPVAVHYDHGLTFDRCMQALKLGFSSVMFDGSLGDPVENVKNTKEMVRIAHAFGATVEGEIGHVGNADEEGSVYCHTTPEEAKEFIEKTGVDALAIAIGTAHGAYKQAPKLNFERLSEIKKETNVPLVLHGGSGLTDEDFKKAIALGISKINIYTDLCLAGQRAMRDGLEQGLSYLSVRDLKVKYIKDAVIEKMTLFGSCQKA